MVTDSGRPRHRDKGDPQALLTVLVAIGLAWIADMPLLPAFAALLASLLFGEAYRAHHAVGIGVLLLGVRVAGGGRRPA